LPGQCPRHHITNTLEPSLRLLLSTLIGPSLRCRRNSRRKIHLPRLHLLPIVMLCARDLQRRTTPRRRVCLATALTRLWTIDTSQALPLDNTGPTLLTNSSILTFRDMAPPRPATRMTLLHIFLETGLRLPTRLVKLLPRDSMRP